MAAWYLVLALLLSLAHYRISFRVIEAAIAIGDSGNPVLTRLHSCALAVLAFPMLTVGNPVGDLLEKRLRLTPNGAMFLCMGVNAVFSGSLCTWCVSALWGWL